MRLRKLLLLTGAIVFSVIAFIINAATKNVDLASSFLQSVRSMSIVLSFASLYGYVQVVKRERTRGIIAGIGAVAVVAGIFLASYLVISFLPLKGFETRDLTLYPRDYQTIFFSSIISIISGIFAIVTLLYIKDLILYKRKKTTMRNFLLLVGSLVIAALSELVNKPLEDSTLSVIFLVTSILLIIVNSFRLG